MIADGHVYISIEDGLGNLAHGRLVALRASDGVQLWSRACDDVPTLDAGGGLVVMALLGDQVIDALHATNGSLAWQAHYTGEVQVLGGLVYVDDSSAPLIALDERTGALVWTLPCWKQTSIASGASGTQIYIGCLEPRSPAAAGEEVFTFDTQQRQLLWKYQTIDPHTAPVVGTNLVFIPTGTALDAVRASDGKRVWSQQAEEPNAGPIALARIGDTLYVRMSVIYPHVIIVGCDAICEQRSYSLSALRPSDGAAYWRHYELRNTLGLTSSAMGGSPLQVSR